MVSEEVL